MSEISETEIKSMTKEQNYMRGYEDGKSDVLDEIRAEIADEKIDFDLDIGQEIHYNRAIDDVLAIIDRYRKGEQE